MKIAVCLHLYYIDLFEEIHKYLTNLSAHHFDIFVTMPRENKAFLPTLRKYYPKAHVIITENIGWDIYPFIKFLNSFPVEDYDVLFKIHTKKDIPIEYSLNGIDLSGNLWRNYLLKAILGSPARVEHILRIISRHHHIAMIGAQEVLITGSDNISLDLDLNALNSLMYKLRLPIRSYEFIAGSIFAIRPLYLTPIKKCAFTAHDFPPYSPRDWNGLPYCLERAFGCMISSQGACVVGLPSL